VRQPSRGTARKTGSPHRVLGQAAAAENALRQAITLAGLDHRLSRLTWFEIGLAVEGPTPFDGSAGRRRNRFAALRPEIAAGRTTLSRVSRVRALTYLLHEVRGLRAELGAKGRLTVTQLTRVRWVFGGHSGPLRDYFIDAAERSDQPSSAMRDALAIEEGLLVRTLKIVRRVPDPLPRLTVGQIRGLSTPQLLRLLTAAHHEQREYRLLLGLVAHFCETNPRRD
jgi:hypothetical protein